MDESKVSNRPRETRRLLHRRAWQTLAWTLVWVVGSQVAVRGLILRRPELVDVEFGRKLADLQAAVSKQPERPLVLMLGSSRVATGFRPDALVGGVSKGQNDPLAFNFAQVGSGPEIAHLTLQRLLNSGVKPSWVLLEFWPPTWGAVRSLHEFRDQVEIGALHWNEVRLLAHYVARPKYLYRQWYLSLLVPTFAHRDQLVGGLTPTLALKSPEPDRRCLNLDALGWWSPKQTVEEDERLELIAQYEKTYQQRLQRFAIAKVPDRALRAMISLCQSQEIRVSVVVLPEGRSFQSLYPDSAMAEIRQYLTTIARETGVQVVDARDWVGEDGFMDGHHLLPTGAAIFTQRLGREILQTQVAVRSDQTGRN